MYRDLKPCPFCGEDGPIMDLYEPMFNVISANRFDSKRYAVGCDNDRCRASGPWARTMTEAIDAWNNRSETHA